jgi:hypothetical protein
MIRAFGNEEKCYTSLRREYFLIAHLEFSLVRSVLRFYPKAHGPDCSPLNW